MRKNRIKILLVEDNKDHIEFITELLSNSSLIEIKTDIANGFQGTKQLISTNRYDLILLDSILPDCPYNETLKSLTKLVECTPIVVLTTLDDPDTIFGAINDGANDCIPKEQLSSALLERTIIYSLDRFRKEQSIKQSEEQLKLHRGHLEELVDKRTAEIEKANKELKDSKRTISTLMSNLPGMAYRCKNDKNWTMEYVSKGALKLTGYKPNDIANKNTISFNEIIHPEDRKQHWGKVQNALSKRKPFQLIYRIVDSKGTEKWVWEQGCGIFSNNGDIEALEGFITDISEQKKFEKALIKSNEQLVHSEKLAAIGKLSASIAHEFNNPICGIKNVLECVAKNEINTKTNESDKKLVNMAINECYRITSLIRKMHDFYRPSTGKIVLFNLHSTIDDIIIIYRKKLNQRNISLKRHYDDNLPEIKGVPDQIKQVILNLMQNAEESIHKDAGQIDIVTKHVGSNVMIQVKDNGIGIAPDNMSSIFDPYFSTKPIVKGIGLGLSVCHGIIKKHHGSIKVESKEGEGSTFTVIIPINERAN